MSDLVHYIIIEVSEYYYNDHLYGTRVYGTRDFQGVIETVTDKWSTCNINEFEALKEYVDHLSTDKAEYKIIVRKDIEPISKPNFTIQAALDFKKDKEIQKLKLEMENAAKKALDAQKSKDRRVKKLMKELNLTEEAVNILLQ